MRDLIKKEGNKSEWTLFVEGISRSKLSKVFNVCFPSFSRWKPVVTPICGFLRLSKGVYMPDTMEVNIPIRFVFVFLVPIDSRQDPHGVGRAFGTLMANPVI